MTLPRSWLLPLSLALIVVLWVWSGDWGDDPDTSLAPSAGASSSTLPRVRVRDSEARPMTSQLTLQGRTVAERTVLLRAETHGVVQEVKVERGARVKESALLVKLAVDDRQVRLQEARSALAQARAEFDASAALKKRGYQADTEVARAQAALDAAAAAVRLAELELARVVVQSPIAGVVNERHVELGTFLDRGDPIVTIVDLDPIRVVGQVSERYLGQIRKGAVGTARFIEGTSVYGVVRYVGRVASESTRTFPVELEVPNPDERIIEGVTAELSLPIDLVKAHRVSASALTLSDSGQLGIMAVDDDKKVVFHEVQILGDSPEGLWLGGLPPTLRLVTLGQEFVRPGQQVEPVAAEDSAAAGAP